MNNRHDDFQSATRRQRLQRLAIGLLLLLTFLLTQLLVGQLRTRHNPLDCLQPSSELIELTNRLPQQLNITFFYGKSDLAPNNERALSALQTFLRNYQNRLTKEGIEPTYQLLEIGRDGEKIQQQIASKAMPYQPELLIQCGQERTRIAFNELGHLDGNDFSKDQLNEFLIRAIHNIFRFYQRTIYFTCGHGECSLEDAKTGRGLSRLADLLAMRGIQCLPLTLDNLDKIDPKQATIFVVDPQTDLLHSEEAALQNLLEQQSGRLVLLLHRPTSGSLGNLLQEWGLALDQWELRPPKRETLKMGILASVSSQRPSFQRLQQQKMSIQFESLYPVREDPEAPEDGCRHLDTLLTSYGRTDNGPVDHYPVAMLSERRLNSQLPISLPHGKLVLFGGNFLTNRSLRLLANSQLLDALMSELFEDQLFPHKNSPKLLQFTLPKRDYDRLFKIFIVFPGFLFLWAMAIWIFRRNR